jgi:hypothetical protein
MNSEGSIEDTFIKLIGAAVDSPLISGYEQQFEAAPQIKEYEGERRYHTYKKRGLSLCFDCGELKSVLLYGVDVEPGVAAYDGRLPRELQFSDSPELVLRKLGAPLRSSPAGKAAFRGVPRHPWFKYALDSGCELHIEFDASRSRIRIITIQRAA